MLENLKITRKRKACKVGRFYDSLTKEDKAIFDEAIGDNGMGMKNLAAELTKRGFSVSETPLYAHRSKTCGCYRA